MCWTEPVNEKYTSRMIEEEFNLRAEIQGDLSAFMDDEITWPEYLERVARRQERFEGAKNGNL